VQERECGRHSGDIHLRLSKIDFAIYFFALRLWPADI
jgi:hypothetical protein